MKCEKCQKSEATYDAPGNWCDDCWDDWWFKDYTPEQRDEDQPFNYVCRAFSDLEDKSDDSVMKHVMRMGRGTLNPAKVREAIQLYREINED